MNPESITMLEQLLRNIDTYKSNFNLPSNHMPIQQKTAVLAYFNSIKRDIEEVINNETHKD